MDDSQHSQSVAAYATRLNRTLRALQKRVAEQEALLGELRAASSPLEEEPSSHPETHLFQLRALKHAYDSITPTEPWLPSSESPLPALLALRNTDTLIRGTQDCITRAEIDVKTASQLLEKERADLADAKLLQDAIKQRTLSLEQKIETQTQRSSAQAARDMIREVKRKRNYYDAETGTLVGAFNQFIEDHLAVMLAAEQLGGPVTGQEPGIAVESLEAGFSSQGKAKKATAKPNGDKRQRRIDSIWGAKPQEVVDEGESWDEKTAAAADMRELTEQLLNSLVEADGKGPGAYVQLQQDSAAARFLVRSKVAQFHPVNGTKIRLFDFGGEIDD